MNEQTITVKDDEVLKGTIVKNSEEIVSNANSKGLIQDYYNVEGISNNKYGVLGRVPNFDPRKVINVIRNDPTVKGAIITLVDKMFEGGWRITPNSEEKLKQLKKLRFNKVLKKVAYNCFLYNNAFIEIVGTPENVKDLNLLEVTLLKIDAEDNGDLNGYFMYVGGRTKRPYWKPEKVAHFKIDDFTTNLWSEFNIQAIYETIQIKDYARQWLSWFFGTNQIRPVINIQGASTVKVGELLSFLKSSEANIRKPLVFEGEVVISKLQSFADEGKSVLDLLSWCDEQILILMQVPPIAVGKADQSGRSNSAELNTALRTRILSVMEDIQDTVTLELFPKIGMDETEFYFRNGDTALRTQIIDDILKLKQAEFSDEAITEYLEMNGLHFETKKIMNDPEDMMKLQQKYAPKPTGGFGNNPNKSASGNSPNAPSRKTQTNTNPSKGATVVKNAESPFSDTDLEPDPHWVL